MGEVFENDFLYFHSVSLKYSRTSAVCVSTERWCFNFFNFSEYEQGPLTLIRTLVERFFNVLSDPPIDDATTVAKFTTLAVSLYVTKLFERW